MLPLPTRLALGALACLLALPAMAAKVAKIEIQGLPDAAMAANVRSALSLNNELDKDLRPRRLAYLLRRAADEARTALEPFGYYSPAITVARSDGAAIDAETDESEDAVETTADSPLTVTLRIVPGDPVHVRGFDVGVDGAAADDALVADAVARFRPRSGDILDHRRYEDAKARINHALADHGYFDADYASHRVEVTRAEQAADIALRWASGPRYGFGPTLFTQTPAPFLRDGLLQKLVPWQPGEPYDEAEVDRLRRSLVALDYFALVDVQVAPDKAQDGRAPVEVTLSPAPRSIYTVGVSYGTLDGPGIQLGVERRYLNSRGHKALAQVDWASRRKAATLQYRVPAFAWLDGWYSASLQAIDEQTDYVDSRRLEFVASRSGQVNDHLNLVASLHVLRERWAYMTILRPIRSFRFASLVYPALRADYVDVDDRMAPRRGMGGSLVLRGGRGDAGFLQLYLGLQWFHGFNADSRLIARGELGHTFTDDVLDLPPSLRFYAGGDRSVRGYGWHEIGPRISTSGGVYHTGAPNLLTASLEYEHYFSGPWGAAVFVDTGSAFSGRKPDLHTGVGIGLRWRSPVGPVRIDLAHGLDAPDSPVTLHLNIGADL